MGYAVIRPLRVRKIGRTVIKPSIADPNAEFHLVGASFDVNIAGSDLRVQGVPFLEQDARVAACASAAIWMATTAASQRFGDLPSSTATEITELALGFDVGERVYGSTGLSQNEMVHALRMVGYNPLSLATPDRSAVMEAIHGYLEGGLAPILLVTVAEGNHAIVAVGHTYNVKLNPTDRAEVIWKDGPIRFWRSSQWIDALIVHDDQRGLYRRVRFLSDTESASLGLSDTNCLVEIDLTLDQFAKNADWPTSVYANIWGVIVPVPPGISMTSIEAEEGAARLIRMSFDSLGLEVPDDILLRTHLMRSNDFKTRLRGSKMSNRVRNLYRSKPMPRWLWITEFGSKDEVLTEDPANRLIRGEVILDGNSAPATADFISFHLATGAVGFLAMMKPTDLDAGIALAGGVYIRPDPPYQAFTY